MVKALVVSAVFTIVAFLVSYFMDKKDWNNGVCTCGKGFWKSFDVDSSGATGYSCTECDNTIWLGFDFFKDKL